MRALFLCLALSLAGCAAGGVYVEPSPPPGPVYYTYADGACWADDLWYGACPWYVGTTYGYHYRYGGGWYYHPGHAWPRDHRQPPPRVWVAPPAPRVHVPVAPPRAWPSRPIAPAPRHR